MIKAIVTTRPQSGEAKRSDKVAASFIVNASSLRAKLIVLLLDNKQCQTKTLSERQRARKEIIKNIEAELGGLKNL